MNLNKSYEYFQPEKVTGRIHIIGCGSVGATVAELLTRLGLTKFDLWDFDKVESHNVANQIFRDSDIGELKVNALLKILTEINPEIENGVKIHQEGWNGENLSGYVILAVDNIDLRREIVEKNVDNAFIKAVFDFRTSLETAQHYAADWSNYNLKKALLASMQFTHDEANEEHETSACGGTLGLVCTVRCICEFGVANFIRFIREGKIHKFMNVDVFNGLVDTF